MTKQTPYQNEFNNEITVQLEKLKILNQHLLAMQNDIEHQLPKDLDQDDLKRILPVLKQFNQTVGKYNHAVQKQAKSTKNKQLFHELKEISK